MSETYTRAFMFYDRLKRKIFFFFLPEICKVLWTSAVVYGRINMLSIIIIINVIITRNSGLRTNEIFSGHLMDLFQDSKRQEPPLSPLVLFQPIPEKGNWMNSYVAGTSELELDWKKICLDLCSSVSANCQECLRQKLEMEWKHGVFTKQYFVPCARELIFLSP